MPKQKLYKLTEQDWTTRKGCPNETKWGPGVEHSADPSYRGHGLCSAEFIHCYSHPLIAVFNNPKDADIKDPVLWEAEGEVIEGTKNTKYGVYTLKTIRVIKLPVLSLTQRIAIAIYSSLEVEKNLNFIIWAKNWLNGKDRTQTSAYAAYAYSAAYASAYSAAYAAYASAYSAAAYTVYASAAYASDRSSFDLLTVIRKVQKNRKRFD